MEDWKQVDQTFKISNGTCDVCGKRDDTFLATSTNGSGVHSYCPECSNWGLEPGDVKIPKGAIALSYFEDHCEPIFTQEYLEHAQKWHAENGGHVRILDD